MFCCFFALSLSVVVLDSSCSYSPVSGLNYSRVITTTGPSTNMWNFVWLGPYVPINTLFHSSVFFTKLGTCCRKWLYFAGWFANCLIFENPRRWLFLPRLSFVWVWTNLTRLFRSMGLITNCMHCFTSVFDGKHMFSSLFSRGCNVSREKKRNTLDRQTKPH